MRKLLTAATLVACTGAGTVLVPGAASAAVLADQLVICGGGKGNPLNVTVENLTYDSVGPVQFTLTGVCQTIVDGNPADDPHGTPISSTYRVAAQPIRTVPNDTLTVTTSAGDTSTYFGTDEVTVRVSSLEGVQVTFGH